MSESKFTFYSNAKSDSLQVNSHLLSSLNHYDQDEIGLALLYLQYLFYHTMFVPKLPSYQTKLQEGNVFTAVCLFTGGPMWPLPIMHWTSLYKAPDMGPTPLGHQTWGLTVPPHCYWHLMIITEDLFKLVHVSS